MQTITFFLDFYLKIKVTFIKLCSLLVLPTCGICK